MEVLVSQLEREAHQLEQDGDDIRAIRMMERALAQRIAARMQGSIPAAERLVVKYNTVAVRCFKNDDFDAATTLLSSALELTSDGSVIFMESESVRVKLRGTTLNNFGCLERRRGNMPAAASYLKQSIEHAGQESPASFLNLSAVLTNLGRYTDAVAWSRRAIAILELQSTLAAGRTKKEGEKEHPPDSPGLMAIAYHNLASPLEQLDRAAAIAAYRKGLEIARAEIGVNSSTTRSIQNSLDKFLRMAPQQVTAAGSPAQAQQQFAAGATSSNVPGSLADPNAIPTSAARKGNLPVANSFLPPMMMGTSTSSSAAARTGSAEKRAAIAMANTPRGRAMALAAARRKGATSSSSSSSPHQHQQQFSRTASSTSARRLSPIRGGGGGGGRATISPPGSSQSGRARASPLAREEVKARREQAEERMMERTRKAEERRERVAAARAEKQENFRVQQQERVHSRTPPPPGSRQHLSKEEREKELREQRYQRDRESREKAASARKASAADRDRDYELMKQRRQQQAAAEASSSSGPSPDSKNKTQRHQQKEKREPKPPAPGTGGGGGGRRQSTPPSRRSSVGPSGGDETNNKTQHRAAAGGRRGSATATTADNNKPASSSRGGASTSATSAGSDRNAGRQFTRKVEGAGSGNPVKDLEEEISKKDDIVSFMVARLAALLRAEEDFERCYIAVCRIQCLFRRIRAKVTVQVMRRERQVAIIYRRVREDNAARTIVRYFRDLVARRQEAVLAELRNDEIRAMNNQMASKMQRMSRVWLAKRELTRRKADALRHSKALRCLQCFFRKLLAKRNATLLRGTLRAAQQEKLRLEQQDFAAAQIQRVFLGRRDALKIHRLRRSMRMLREKELESRRTASSKRIQAVWRGHVGRCKARVKRAEAAALRTKRERWQLIVRTAIKLQAVARGLIARNNSGPELADFRRRQHALKEKFVHDAATKINSSVRGFLARRGCKRAAIARTAAQKHDWGVYLLPNLQAFTRARVSAGRSARRMQASLEHDVVTVEQRRCQREALSQIENEARETIAADVAQKELEDVLAWRATDLMRAKGATARREEEEEKARRQIVAEQMEQLKMQQELASSGPVLADVKRKGKVSDELKPQPSKIDELDEEEEHLQYHQSASGAMMMEKNRVDASGAASETHLSQKQATTPSPNKRKLRGPFYTSTSSSPSSSSSQQPQQYASNRVGRGLSTQAREELRKLELSERMQQKMREQEQEEQERKQVLAAAAGMRGHVTQAVERTKTVIDEPLMKADEATATVPLFTPTSTSSSKITATTSNDVSQEDEDKKLGIDFSKLEAYRAAHRDQVLNAITRHSISLVQAILRQRISSDIADDRAASFLKRLPVLSQSSTTISAFLAALPAVSEFHRKEQVAVLNLQGQVNAVSSTRQAVNVIQASAAAQLDADLVRMKSLAKFQELDYAASRIQGAAREAIQRKDGSRLDRLQRENLRRRTTDGTDLVAKSVEQSRDYAARRITEFLRTYGGGGGRAERREQARQEASSRKPSSSSSSYSSSSPAVLSLAQREAASKSEEREVAAIMIQKFARIVLRRRPAKKARNRDVTRRRQLLIAPAEEGEQLFAVVMIQAAARILLRRIRRRRALAQRRVPEASKQLDFERDFAATKIQSVARGRAARNRRRLLEREKAQKWAGLLDEEIEHQRASAAPSESREEDEAAKVAEPVVAPLPPAAASDAEDVAAADHDKDADDQEAAVAATKIQSAFRGKAARGKAGELREHKKQEWERMAQEAEVEEQEL